MDASQAHFHHRPSRAITCPLMQPLVIAGVDPAAEASLAGLDRCVTDGRLLDSADKPRDIGTPDDEQFTQIPTMVSTSAFVDEPLTVTIEEAGPSPEVRDPTHQRDWHVLRTETTSFQELYEQYASSIHDYVDYWPVWSSGEVAYNVKETGETPRVAARTVRPDLSIFNKASSFVEFDVADSLLVPPEAHDAWFRPVTEHRDVPAAAPGTSYRPKMWQIVGNYDPTCLPGFDPLAGGGLETYSYPSVKDQATGRVLTPGRSMSGYLNSPPLVLTNLAGAAWLSDPDRYAGQPGAAFISAIRVRVVGLAGPTREAQQVLARIATEIADKTGLQVDVVKGSSPLPVTVDLPPGAFGRPGLSVTEGWSRKGVVLSFREAARSQDIAVVSIVLLCGFLFIAETGVIAVERRRRQLRILRALGWSRMSIATLAELEIVCVGIIAALASLALTVVLSLMTDLAVNPAVLVIGPISSVVIATLAGIPSCFRASRAHILSTPPAIRRSREPAASIASFALSDILRSPATFALGAVALGLSASLFAGLVLIAASFNGHLDATVLGTHLAAEVAPLHFVIGALGLVLGAGAAGQALALKYLERVPEFATLRAIGWSRRTIAAVLAVQGIAILGVACWIGIWATLVLTLLVGASPTSVAVAFLAGGLAATVAMALGVLVPIAETGRRNVSATMEE
jgi:putative ABC transport system permease protein